MSRLLFNSESISEFVSTLPQQLLRQQDFTTPADQRNTIRMNECLSHDRLSTAFHPQRTKNSLVTHKLMVSLGSGRLPYASSRLMACRTVLLLTPINSKLLPQTLFLLVLCYLLILPASPHQTRHRLLASSSKTLRVQ